jgi:hypothetical protein
VRHAEPRGGLRAVAFVSVEKLHDAERPPELPRARLRVRPGDRIDEPDPAVGGERVRRAAQRVVLVEPAEAEVPLVAEAH